MKYILSAQITVSAYCEVEADSLEEAIKKSEELTPEMHFNGSGTVPEENWCVTDIDGTPENIKEI